jgi:hypothetical protein
MEGMMEVSKTLTQLQNCNNNKYAQNLKYSKIKKYDLNFFYNMLLCSHAFQWILLLPLFV